MKSLVSTSLLFATLQLVAQESNQPIYLKTDTLPIIYENISGENLCYPQGKGGLISYSNDIVSVVTEPAAVSKSASLDPAFLYLTPNPYTNSTGNLPKCMHEDDNNSDCSRLAGPNPSRRIQANYLMNNAKLGGYYYPGMTPTFTFLNDTIMACIRFGAKNNLLVTINPNTLAVRDQTYFVGRQKRISKLMQLGCRFSLFSSTTGGAYFFVDSEKRIVVPVTEFYTEKRGGGKSGKYTCSNTDASIEESGIWRYTVNQSTGEFESLEKFVVTPSNQNNPICNSMTNNVYLRDTALYKMYKERGLTATLPDANGMLWFTTDRGEVFVFDPSDPTGNYYYTDLNELTFNLQYHVLQQQLHFPINPNNYDSFSQLIDSLCGDRSASLQKNLSLNGKSKYYRASIEQFNTCDSCPQHRIQNSFLNDGIYVYVITNEALFKLSFDQTTNRIISHFNEYTIVSGSFNGTHTPSNTFCGKYYTNSGIRLPGHVQAGSGTTPTLLTSLHKGDTIKQILFCDNDFPRINFNAVDANTGELIDTIPLFGWTGSACENSVIAYNLEAAVANTFGYRFPYKKQSTMPGGLEKLTYDPALRRWSINEEWRTLNASFDCKTATPKLSLPDGLLYVYNVDEEDRNKVGGNWKISALDWTTGETKFTLTPQFKEGKKNNLWGTFTIGNDQSFFIAAQNGFFKIY